MTRVLKQLVLMLWITLPISAYGHTLGIDRAQLVEVTPGAYRVVSEVPRSIAPAIRTPVLPARCIFVDNPSGERGSYSVTFSFTCAPALTADDTLSLPWQREGVLLSVEWYGQEAVTRLASRDGATIDVPLGDWSAGSGSLAKAASRYTLLGIEHILSGIDHLLFVLCLIFIVNGRWQLIKTITAFTVAHSITLGLATFGFLTLPPAPVESAIALSIVFLAAEIIRKQKGATSLTFEYPWLIAFAFGLLHGLGFAGALSEIGLPPQEVPAALFFFNVGVEVGQLIFVAAILAVMALARSFFGLRLPIAPLRSAVVYVIGVVAMYWFLERSAEIFQQGTSVSLI